MTLVAASLDWIWRDHSTLLHRGLFWQLNVSKRSEFMDEIIADFNTQYPGAVPPSRKTIWWGDIDLRRHSSGFILDRWGEIPAFLAFWGDLQFWMGIWNVLRWNGLKILIPKHTWKSKIGPLKQIWASKRYGTLTLHSHYIHITFTLHLHIDGASSRSFERHFCTGKASPQSAF